MRLDFAYADDWIQGVMFDAERRFEVEDAAASLSRAVGGMLLRIVDDDGTVRELNRNGVFRERTTTSNP